MHHQGLNTFGSIGAVVGAVFAFVGPDSTSRLAAILLGTAGALTAAGPIITALAKIWADNRTADRAMREASAERDRAMREASAERDRISKEERHHLADKLQEALSRIELLDHVVEDNRQTIADLRARLARVASDTPLPPREG